MKPGGSGGPDPPGNLDPACGGAMVLKHGQGWIQAAGAERIADATDHPTPHHSTSLRSAEPDALILSFTVQLSPLEEVHVYLRDRKTEAAASARDLRTEQRW